MTENVQEGQQAVPQDAHPTPPPEDPRVVSRRWLLIKVAGFFGAIVAIVIAIPVVRYLIGPWRRPGGFNAWVTLGSVGQFPAGQTRLATFVNPYSHPWDGYTDKSACWVRHISGSQYQVFAINCAHLGCPVRWFPQSELFMCPCHGGVYYADGARASGPPPRGLFTYKHKVVGDELHIFAGQLPTLSTQAKLRALHDAGSKGNGTCLS